MKKWKILSESRIKNQESRIRDVIRILLENREIKTKREIEKFLDPQLADVTIKNVGIDKKQLQKAIRRIQTAIKNKEQIVVYGDYDVDGISGTAILWETLHNLGAKVLPYIPHRVEEGYGLSVKGIENLLSLKVPPLQRWNLAKTRVIITVDNGIVADKAVEAARKNNIDVIITDHHVPSKKLPDAVAIVHTTKLCGAGVVWMFSNVILNPSTALRVDSVKNLRDPSSVSRRTQDDILMSHLELVALATVADLVPLVGANRTLLKFGLETIRKTKRVGLLELFKEAVLDPQKIGVYEIGHIIAPRLNAMGRLEHAMDSLRLICTSNQKRAEELARLLGSTNRERQDLTLETFGNSKFKIQNSKLQFKFKKLLFIADSSYEQGIIGLVAGKLVDEYYRPAIVVSIGEKYSKASARSISGFNMIEFIRASSELLVDAGGHPMAAGFTVETAKLSLLQKTLEDRAYELLTEEKLTRTLRIDCELGLSLIDNNLYDEIQKLSPFGMGNPEPTFISRRVEIEDIRVVGKEGNHLKLVVSQKNISSRHSGEDSGLSRGRLQNLSNSFVAEGDSGRSASWRIARMTRGFEGIAFGMGDRYSEFKIGDMVDIVYTISEDRWNGNRKLQLKIKDIRK